MAGTEIEQPATTTAARPIREVLASPDFRRYWLAQFLSALGNGSLRFTFVWLALDLSDSASAPGLVGVALGLPGLLISIPAGAWSDRVDRRHLIVGIQLAAGVVLVVAASAVWADVMSIPLAALLAAALGGLLGAAAPALQAVVPLLVEPHRLMTGVALQGMGMNAALLFGAVVGGGTIAIAGIGGAFAVLAALQVIAALAMARVHLEGPVGARRGGMRGDIAEGMRFALGREPLRSLLGIGLLAGFTWGIVSILLPEVGKDVMGMGAFKTSLWFTGLGVGLFLTSLVLASRHDIARPGLLIAVAISTGLGGGVLAMGLSRSYALTMVVMLAWGVGGGISMTLQRGLLQRHTPPELMGRVMGISSLAMLGSFPLAAALASVLSATMGPADALTATGVVAIAAAMFLGWRAPVRTA
ncbi:MAG TPA: MFS transporter [Acidimicrobiales bacterium]|nr:MFS transporter [Acidimicrobiales bacterium]